MARLFESFGLARSRPSVAASSATSLRRRSLDLSDPAAGEHEQVDRGPWTGGNAPASRHPDPHPPQPDAREHESEQGQPPAADGRNLEDGGRRGQENFLVEVWIAAGQVGGRVEGDGAAVEAGAVGVAAGGVGDLGDRSGSVEEDLALPSGLPPVGSVVVEKATAPSATLGACDWAPVVSVIWVNDPPCQRKISMLPSGFPPSSRRSIGTRSSCRRSWRQRSRRSRYW